MSITVSDIKIGELVEGLVMTGEKVGFKTKDFLALANNERLMAQVLKVIHNQAEIVMKKFAVWLRAKVGGITTDDLVTLLDRTHAGGGLVFHLSDSARDVMGKPAFTLTSKYEEVNVVVATPEDLGFKKPPTTTKLFDEVNLAKHGLELCLPDDGPSLRLFYKNQPDKERMPIAMKPICSSLGRWCVFSLIRDGHKLWLHTNDADPQDCWEMLQPLVFRSKKIHN